MSKTAQFVTLYFQAEARANPAPNGVTFRAEDRKALDQMRIELQLGVEDAARLVMAGKLFNSQEYSKHWNRFNTFARQGKKGKFNVAPSPTGRIIRSEPELQNLPKVNNRADLQPAFNELTGRLIKLGITNVDSAVSYLHNGFEHHRTEQKLGTRANRITEELNLGDLTKEQQLAVLDRVKAAIVA